MATTRHATTHWEGSLLEGGGRVSFDSSGVGTYEVTWASRAQDPAGRTSPEELIAAAHSSCFSMALSNGLTKGGHVPDQLDTTASVTFQPGEGITGIVLSVVGRVPGMTSDEFRTAAEDAKANCPVSKALTGTTIRLEATLSAG